MITNIETKREEKKQESLSQLNNDLNYLFAELARILAVINDIQDNIKKFTNEGVEN